MWIFCAHHMEAGESRSSAVRQLAHASGLAERVTSRAPRRRCCMTSARSTPRRAAHGGRASKCGRERRFASRRGHDLAHIVQRAKRRLVKLTSSRPLSEASATADRVFIAERRQSRAICDRRVREKSASQQLPPPPPQYSRRWRV